MAQIERVSEQRGSDEARRSYAVAILRKDILDGAGELARMRTDGRIDPSKVDDVTGGIHTTYLLYSTLWGIRYSIGVQADYLVPMATRQTVSRVERIRRRLARVDATALLGDEEKTISSAGVEGEFDGISISAHAPQEAYLRVLQRPARGVTKTVFVPLSMVTDATVS